MKSKHASRQQPQHPEEVTRDQVVAHLEKLSQAASIRQIAHGMGLRHHGRRYLPRVIEKLLRAGEIDEIHGGRYRLANQKQKPSRAAQPSRSVAHADKNSPDRADDSHRDAAKAFAARRSRDPNLVSGRIVAHRDGYGFLVADQPISGVEGDLFIGRDGLDEAMHGDHVLARITRRRSGGRAEGRVVRILERENPSVVGLFRYGPHGNVVLPYDTRIPHEISIPPGCELTPDLQQKLGVAPDRQPASIRRVRLPELDGAVVNVEITRFPKGGLAPAGRVIEILGRPGDIGVDVEIMIRKHHLPHVFPPEALAEAHAAPQQVDESARMGRRDFRALPIVTIDGETARDFDDAVYVRPLPGGHFELQVHIADVAHYVRRGSPLDNEARLRGTSVYFPNRAVPMLPEELSNGICSLNPHVDRLVMSVLMEIDRNGETVRADFAPGLIRSAERMTYTNVNKVLESDPEMTARYASLADGFRYMKELALILNHRRQSRGSIDFDLPEPVIQFDEFGAMTAILRSERNIAHRLIEEFMLAANEAVAEYLDRAGVASLYRVHEKPDPKKVLEFEELAQAFGYSLGVEDLTERRISVRHGQVRPLARSHGQGREQPRGRMRPMTVTLPAAGEIDIRPQHYQRLTEKIAGKPEERILSYLMLRSLKQARYAAELLGHFALGVREYTHFTSPIRRYPDLIVHRVLKWALENADSLAAHQAPVRAPRPRRELASRPARRDGDAPLPTLGPYRRIVLEETASETSEAERRAEAAERELMEWKTAQFMEGHLGEEYDALIISVQKFGFFVELAEIFVEGLVPIDRLEESTGLRCIYRERDHAIIAETHRGSRGGAGRLFRLGDIVHVRAERIEPLRRRVEFAIV
ncbi:MAG: ribonuclease R family protein [Candidatus Acidiferrales bacterium]